MCMHDNYINLCCKFLKLLQNFFLNLYLLNDAENIEGCNRHGTKISDLCILPSSSEEQVVKHDQAKSLP